LFVNECKNRCFADLKRPNKKSCLTVLFKRARAFNMFLSTSPYSHSPPITIEVGPSVGNQPAVLR
jgi:hypothetical protein